MGIGDYPAGFEPAGDPVPSVTPSLARTRPLALQLDPITRAHVYDSTTGLYAELHPIDAKVANALLWSLKAMPGSPASGAGWKRIRSPHQRDAAATANDIVRTALADMVRTKAITLVLIRFEPHQENASFVEVTYVNNQTGVEQTQRFAAG